MATLPPESALRVTLIADPTFAAITTAIYPFGDVPTDAALPYSAYSRISTEHIHDVDGAAGLATARIQIDHYAESLATVRSMRLAAWEAFGGFQGTVTNAGDTLEIETAKVEDENDIAFPPDGGKAKRILGISQDWLISYRETIPTF